MAAEAESITLKSQEGEDVECPLEVARNLGLVAEFFDGADNIEAGAEYECLDATADILRMIVDFITRNNENPITEIDKPLKNEKLGDNKVPGWAVEWIDNKELKEIFELLQAAAYLQIPTLVDLSAAAIAAAIKKMPEAEHDATFALSRDFTPEEEQMIREENKWAEE